MNLSNSLVLLISLYTSNNVTHSRSSTFIDEITYRDFLHTYHTKIKEIPWIQTTEIDKHVKNNINSLEKLHNITKQEIIALGK